MDKATLIQDIQKKRLIFTVTTGRSGTAYLTNVFTYMKGVHAFHEPAPEYVDVLRSVQADSALAHRFLLNKKLPFIAEDSAEIYVETSHLICKGFLEPLLEIGIIPDLVIHRRPMRDISLSLLKMGTIPGRTEKALRFYLSPNDPDVLSIRNCDLLQDYQLCYWYCLEIERRARKYKILFQEHGAKVVETTLQGLKTEKGIKQLQEELNLRFHFPGWLTRFRFMRNSQFKINESKITKKKVYVPDNLDELEREVIQRIDQKELEKWLPELAS